MEEILTWLKITGSQILYYNTTSKEITSGVKTFVIDHPTDTEKYLVHACLEGPEAGVYYRGIGEIANGHRSTIIELPEYVESIATDFTVQITRIVDFDEEDMDEMNIELRTSLVKNNRFKVFGGSCRFFWHVYGKRRSILVEPYKKDVNIRGDGPYKWI